MKGKPGIFRHRFRAPRHKYIFFDKKDKKFYRSNLNPASKPMVRGSSVLMLFG